MCCELCVLGSGSQSTLSSPHRQQQQQQLQQQKLSPPPPPTPVRGEGKGKGEREIPRLTGGPGHGRWAVRRPEQREGGRMRAPAARDSSSLRVSRGLPSLHISPGRRFFPRAVYVTGDAWEVARWALLAPASRACALSPPQPPPPPWCLLETVQQLHCPTAAGPKGVETVQLSQGGALEINKSRMKRMSDYHIVWRK